MENATNVYYSVRPKRFGELRKVLSPITEQMLTKQLRELENHNLISRNDFKTVWNIR